MPDVKKERKNTDKISDAISKLLALGQKKGELTYEEIGDALEKMELSTEEMDMLFEQLNQFGVDLKDGEEMEHPDEEPDAAALEDEDN